MLGEQAHKWDLPMLSSQECGVDGGCRAGLGGAGHGAQGRYGDLDVPWGLPWATLCFTLGICRDRQRAQRSCTAKLSTGGGGGVTCTGYQFTRHQLCQPFQVYAHIQVSPHTLDNRSYLSFPP